jgi:hypothetical protein
MTPSDKPFDSANEPENTQNNPPLSSPASDAAALQAIEALEAESNELPESPSETPIPATPATPPVTQATQAPVMTSSPAPDIAASLNEEPTAPASTEFQPFAGKKKSAKKPLIIIAAILVVIGLGIGGYFGWQYLQSQNNTTAPIQNVPEEEISGEGTEPTNTSLSEDITEIETELDTIEDTEYDDETLSDETLYN